MIDHKGKRKILRGLLDSGCSKTIVLKKFTNKYSRNKLNEKDCVKYETYNGYFRTESKAQLQLRLVEFNKFKNKVNFIHLRNVKIEKDKKSFYESNHLSGDVDFVKLIKMILKEEKRRSKNKKIDIPMRPDHGHALLDDQKKKTFNPGYTAIGRLMGLSELRGIIKAVKYEKKTH